jgi:hypothetical protein
LPCLLLAIVRASAPSPIPPPIPSKSFRAAVASDTSVSKFATDDILNHSARINFLVSHSKQEKVKKNVGNTKELSVIIEM